MLYGETDKCFPTNYLLNVYFHILTVFPVCSQEIISFNFNGSTLTLLNGSDKVFFATFKLTSWEDQESTEIVC